MGRDRAAYMREYRKRTKVVDMTTVPGRIEASFDIVKAELQIAELEAEVARLKRELSSRPLTAQPLALHSFGAPRPAPKPGK